MFVPEHQTLLRVTVDKLGPWIDSLDEGAVRRSTQAQGSDQPLLRRLDVRGAGLHGPPSFQQDTGTEHDSPDPDDGPCHTGVPEDADVTEDAVAVRDV